MGQVSASADEVEEKKRSAGTLWRQSLLLIVLWLLVVWSLGALWSATAQYHYGWLVPPLALYAASVRWRTRPDPGRPVAGILWVGALAALLLLPTWLILQPNPDWRVLNWILVGQVIVVSLAIVGWAGGVAWARHFLFPLCFVLAATPWPRPVEIPLMEMLMQSVATMSVDLLNVVGIASVQQGNIIEVKSGLLQVDEACSGVRSLQAALMSGLFFGEFFRLNLLRKCALVAIAAATAILTNVGRTFFLGWRAAHAGVAEMESWHDRAGVTILTVCLLVIWLVGRRMGKQDIAFPGERSVAPARSLPRFFAVGMLAWVALCILATELWFYTGKEARESAWRMRRPPGSEKIPINAVVNEEMQADISIAARWERSPAEMWRMFYFEWGAGPARPRIVARLHRPETCLSGIGLVMLRDRGLIDVRAAGTVLPFHAYLFSEQGRMVHVYHGIWETSSSRGRDRSAIGAVTFPGLKSVWSRERNLGQQIAEFAVIGFTAPEQADAALERELEAIITVRADARIGSSEGGKAPPF